MRQDAVLVLASGGLDSTTLLAVAKDEGVSPIGLFVNYGQAARSAEEAAVTQLSDLLQFPLTKARYDGRLFGAGEIRGRNAFLLHAALMEFPANSGVILIGIHAGNDYIDCSPEFLDLMRRSFEFHTGGAISVDAPFQNWSKSDVIETALKLNVPIESTHSCESANLPCGWCDSCLLRAQAIAKMEAR